MYDEVATVVSDMEIKTEEIVGNVDSKHNIWENGNYLDYVDLQRVQIYALCSKDGKGL